MYYHTKTTHEPMGAHHMLHTARVCSVVRAPAANGNRYEGSWEDDMKNGDGRFLYLDKGQMYTGFWVNDVAKCGTVEDFDRDSAPQPPKYPIPEVRPPMRKTCDSYTVDGDVSNTN